MKTANEIVNQSPLGTWTLPPQTTDGLAFGGGGVQSATGQEKQQEQNDEG